MRQASYQIRWIRPKEVLKKIGLIIFYKKQQEEIKLEMVQEITNKYKIKINYE